MPAFTPPKLYTIQCLNGHTWQETETSALGIRAKAHEERGFLDAMAVRSSECEDCGHEDRNRGYSQWEFTDEPD